MLLDHGDSGDNGPLGEQGGGHGGAGTEGTEGTGIINQVVNADHQYPGSTALLLASHEGHVGAIKLLLKRGADVNKTDDEGTTSMFAAAVNAHSDAAHVLLKAGADARAVLNDGSIALHVTAQEGHLDTVRVLAEVWPTNPLAWRLFLMGGGAASELQDYLAPPANRATRNSLPRRRPAG